MRNVNNDRFVRCATIRREFDVSYKQLQEWSTLYPIRFVKTPGGKRMYHYGDIYTLFHKSTAPSAKKKIIYCRVSSAHQKEDLERQRDFMCEKYPGFEYLQDVGSGINFKRPNFLKLIGHVLDGDVATIVVSDRDRLCRFGYEFIEWLCGRYGTQVVVHYFEANERELSDDLLAVCNVFVAKRNGQKSARNRKERVGRMHKDNSIVPQ